MIRLLILTLILGGCVVTAQTKWRDDAMHCVRWGGFWVHRHCEFLLPLIP
jgi:hypothetical protein